MVIVNGKGERIPVKAKHRSWLRVEAEVLRTHLFYGDESGVKIGLVAPDASECWLFEADRIF